MFPPWAPFLYVLMASRSTAARNTFRSATNVVSPCSAKLIERAVETERVELAVRVLAE